MAIFKVTNNNNNGAGSLRQAIDDAGNTAIVVKAADLLNFTYTAYAAGTANVVDVDLTGVTMVANTEYVLTVNAPYVQNFFGGGQETGATYQTRTYVVGVDGTPTVAELQALFVARINADANAYFSATSETGDVGRITADSASAGALVVVAPAGSQITDQTAWVSPSGSVAEVLSYVNNPALVTGAGYNKYRIAYRKMIRHNAVTGLQVCKPVNSIVYLDKDDAGTSAAVTLLTSILNGSYGTTGANTDAKLANTAKYNGCPAV
jgi:hypothetical protein